MERPAADGEEAEKANGHAEVHNQNTNIQNIQIYKIQIYKAYKYTKHTNIQSIQIYKTWGGGREGKWAR